MIAIHTDPGYPDLKNHLIASTGLAFYLDRDHELTEVIGQRLANLRLPDCSSYSELLHDPVEGEKEMDVLIGRLTIGETSFFRDPGQFDAIRDLIGRGLALDRVPVGAVGDGPWAMLDEHGQLLAEILRRLPPPP
ncbi:MAG: hypothetical protein ABSF22_27270, partial [Bryobacteraceae bacterium]